MLFSVSNEGQLNRGRFGCLKENELTQREIYALLLEAIIFQTNPAFYCDPIQKKVITKKYT